MVFNSKEYSFCDVSVYALGRPIVTLRGIEYKTKKNKEVLYAAGETPRSIQHGKREVEGTVTILQSDLIALNRAAQEARKTDCLDLDVDLVITYASEDGIVTTDKIIQASFTEDAYSMKEGDLYMECPLPFIAMDIKKNVI